MSRLFRVSRQTSRDYASAIVTTLLFVSLVLLSGIQAQQFDAADSFPAYTSSSNYRLERGPAVTEEVYSVEFPSVKEPSRGNGNYAGKVMILVGTSLYPLVRDSLTRLYAADLLGEGYSVKIMTMSGGVGDDVRALLKANQTDLRGAMMIGDLPIPYWKFRAFAGAGAMDLAYMDLDGEWRDTTGEGYWDVAAPGSGDLGAEIWVGWLYPTKMGSLAVQAAKVNDYLSRNHQYRTGNSTRQSRAKMFLDGVWATDNDNNIAGISTSLQSLYPVVSQFKDSTRTGRKTYLDSLQADYEFWFVTTHSGFSAHSLHPPTGTEFVRWADIDSIYTQPFFYYVYACGAGAYYLDSCIANYYVLGSASGLTLVASTVIGGMSLNNIGLFLGQVNEGLNFGEALVGYLNPEMVGDPADWVDFSSIMMSILGDPSLHPRQQRLVIEPDGSGDYATIQAAIDASRNGAIILLASGVYRGEGNRDIDFHGKHVTVAPEIVSTQVVVDCEHVGRGFRFHSGENYLSRLAGVTIINGTVSDSGGGILIEGTSSPQIIDCLIRDNSSSNHGGGIAVYGDGSPVVTNCTIVRNSASEAGGIFIGNGLARFENCIVAFNGQGGISYSGPDPTTVVCTDLFGNSGGDWTGSSDLSLSNGNLLANPRFCDTAQGLFGISNVSPCSPIHNGCSRLMGSESVNCFDVCGDADANATVDISDAVFLISFIFTEGPSPDPTSSGDANCDQTVDISDVVYLISFIFTGGPAPCAACK
jgi:parallel beta-helix repeat protein